MVLNNVLNFISAEFASSLEDFADEQWGKSMTVKRCFKHREEVILSDLPIIMMTIPSIEGGTWRPAERDYTVIVRLYCGFCRQDREAAQSEVVSFHEAVEDVLLRMKEANNLPAGVIDIDPKNCTTDEGYFHPVYFFVKDVEIDVVRTL
jgi:hypothetical protein